MRYVTARPGNRYYWQRKGYKLERLPDDEIARHKRALELNAWADANPPSAPAPAPLDFTTIAGIIADYRQQKGYQELSRSSRRLYDSSLDDINQTWGQRKIAAIDKGLCEAYLEGIPALGMRRLARAVLRQVMHRAVSRGQLTVNPTNDIRLELPKARQEYFEDGDLKAFGEACQNHPTHGRLVYIGFMLLLFTGQRPSDVLAMTWRQYDGIAIRLRQQKTRKWVDVPAHPQLKAMLDALRPESDDLLILTQNGRSVLYNNFNHRFNEVKRMAGLDKKQARDLRRTAVVRMAEGGAEIQDIAAVTGHTIERTRQILEVYLPRTRRMAQRGVDRMANVSLTFPAQWLSNKGVTN